jgi:hypothetical protein
MTNSEIETLRAVIKVQLHAIKSVGPDLARFTSPALADQLTKFIDEHDQNEQSVGATQDQECGHLLLIQEALSTVERSLARTLNKIPSLETIDLDDWSKIH